MIINNIFLFNTSYILVPSCTKGGGLFLTLRLLEYLQSLDKIETLGNNFCCTTEIVRTRNNVKLLFWFVNLIFAGKKIIVMTGAGLSTAAGIPDFRSPGTGLYDNFQKYDLPSPQSMFEIGFFKVNLIT